MMLDEYEQRQQDAFLYVCTCVCVSAGGCCGYVDVWMLIIPPGSCAYLAVSTDTSASGAVKPSD